MDKLTKQGLKVFWSVLLFSVLMGFLAFNINIMFLSILCGMLSGISIGVILFLLFLNDLEL